MDATWTVLGGIGASRAWIDAGDNPTVSREFLGALETSGAVRAETGWQPLHLACEGQVFVPLYVKGHSYGEYVFDHAWAHAARRAGIRYYPKLLTAVPFTPTAGRRLLAPAGADLPALAGEALQLVQELARQNALSSWHVLFPHDSEIEAWRGTGMLHRFGVQYHWFNRGYGDFDDFLGRFRQSRRKTVRRERRLVAEQGITLQTLQGDQIEPHHWRVFCECYRATYRKRSGHDGYLNEQFFRTIGERMPRNIVMVLAVHQGRHVAAALCLRSHDTLYGRYWGALQEFDSLHFEACYYQGIEYCLRHGLRRFDPGAQGEHKIPRGFEPILTHSFHWIAHPGLADAVAEYLESERRDIEEYVRAAREWLPFHRGAGDSPQ